MGESAQVEPIVLTLSLFVLGVGVLKTFVTDVGALVREVQPLCWGYAASYVRVNGAFRREGERWFEYQRGVRRYEFEERGRHDGTLFLLNLTERDNEPNWQDISVQIPRCGGNPQVNSKTPPEWVKLDYVWRE